MMTKQEFTSLGKVVRTQGNKGEVRILSFSDKPENLLKLKSRKILVGDPEAAECRTLTLVKLRTHKSLAVVTFKEIGSIEEAQKIVGLTIFVPDEALWELTTDEFFVHQLIGLEVVDLESGLARSIETIREESIV